MKKYLFIIITTLLLTIPLTANAQEAPSNVEKALDIANDELKKNHEFISNDYFLMKNIPPDGPRKDINPDLWAKRTLFVYGTPYDYKEDAGYHRYLGYTMKGNRFTNVFYPNDDWAGGTLDQRNWIPRPWEEGLTKNGSNRFDEHEEYRKGISLQIHDGLASFYGEGSSDEYPGPDCYKGVNSDYYGEWYKYIHILQPPTKWTWGMGRMWHRQSDGDIWYITVPIKPLQSGGAQNLKAKITSIPSDHPEPGDNVKISGTLTNESNKPVTTVVRWTIDGNTAYESEVTVEETRDLNFTFQMPDNDTRVAVEANPNRDMPPNEYTFKDNKDSVNIKKNTLSPVINDDLYLTARSQGGENRYGEYVPAKDRKPGTAKWGDIVTAKLTTRDAPNLDPCYNLINWELESATIEYPQKHPDFTFGHPLPPQGTTKKSMDITGDKTAKIQFTEDWSLNGAEIYDQIAEAKIPGPTYYDVKVNYVMHWKYEKGHLACCGKEDCNPCCVDWETEEEFPSYTVNAKLLVNGTGVQPLAH